MESDIDSAEEGEINMAICHPCNWASGDQTRKTAPFKVTETKRSDFFWF